MDNKIDFKEFPGDYEQRKERIKRNKILLILLFFLLVVILSVLSTIINIKILNK